MPGDGDGSITGWVAGVNAGDLAAQTLWERYFPRMLDVARARLRSSPRWGPDAACDEEDVVLSAFHKACDKTRAISDSTAHPP
jgi:hypothetical protein